MQNILLRVDALLNPIGYFQPPRHHLNACGRNRLVQPAGPVWLPIEACGGDVMAVCAMIGLVHIRTADPAKLFALSSLSPQPAMADRTFSSL